MTVVFPHTFVDGPGNIASGVQVMDNFAVVAGAVEGVSAAAAGTDAYQAGVVNGTDFVAGSVAVNATTGALELTTWGGAAWLPGPVSGLVRTFTTSATVTGLLPPALPGPAGFMCIGVELTASGATAVTSVVSGAEQVSESEAKATPPPTSSGKACVLRVILHNVAGSYSVAKRIDRRPWAVGRVDPQYVARSENFTLQGGELAAVSGTTTAQLPAPAVNSTVTVVAAEGAVVTISRTGAAVIYGDTLTGVTSFILRPRQHVTLVADGTDWRITAGQPKLETTYSALAAITEGVNNTISATRPATVNVVVFLNTIGALTFSVEGVQIGELKAPTAATYLMASFKVLAGQKWSWSKVAGTIGVEAAYLIE